MKWLKQYWYYPILVIFVIAFLCFGAFSTDIKGKALGFLGAVFFAFMGLLGVFQSWMTKAELRRCVAVEEITIDGRKQDCFRFCNSTAGIRLLFVLGLASLPMLVALGYMTAFSSFKVDALLAIFGLGVPALGFATLMRHGLRITPRGLYVTSRLKTLANLYHRKAVFIPWEEIAVIDLAFLKLAITVSNGHSTQVRQIPGAFIGVTLSDARRISAAPAIIETLEKSRREFGYHALIGMATLAKEQQMSSPDVCVAEPTAVVAALQYYLGNESARSDIGTRRGFTELDAKFGDRLRANVANQLDGPLATYYSESGSRQLVS